MSVQVYRQVGGGFVGEASGEVVDHGDADQVVSRCTSYHHFGHFADGPGAPDGEGEVSLDPSEGFAPCLTVSA
ncbi:hypothetical protein GCM10011608_50260 [Micromonospora sonchi]|uniref:Uncharacterized protein n=1 Tax=Micromonospora sonchi TaxID=1763543 RepID=A0A917U557_9ACTN|nr:hypothetical protein [Micromonospora sonchi]GGM59140.1 hypothetical protein GCM10011608_50260 [Micromonospora sonchi]